MSSATRSAQSSGSTDEEIALACAELFLAVTGLNNSDKGGGLTAAQILSAPLESFGVDSLTTMEFVMAVEERFAVELDEKALVDRGRSVGDLATLVAEALKPAPGGPLS